MLGNHLAAALNGSLLTAELAAASLPVDPNEVGRPAWTGDWGALNHRLAGTFEKESSINPLTLVTRYGTVAWAVQAIRTLEDRLTPEEAKEALQWLAKLHEVCDSVL